MSTIRNDVTSISSNMYSIVTGAQQIQSLSMSGNLVVGGNISVLGNFSTPASYHTTLTLSTTSTADGVDSIPAWNTVSDPNNWYATDTKRVTPTVAGWYNVYYQIKFNQGTAGTGKQWNIQILKNGVTIAITQSEAIADVGRTLVTQALIYLNGTTDYLHAQVYASNTTSLATSTGWSRLEMYKIN